MTSAEMDFPLGTIKLEELTRSHAEIILHPTPTDDPNDPLNWSRWRKAINFSLVNFYVLMTFVLVDIGVVAYGPYADIGISYGTINDGWALNYAGLAVGCILFIPFVYKYGRRPVYLFSMLFQMASTIWNAKLNSGGELLAAYCLAGLGGAISETIVQITITDLFFVHQRATANGIFITMQNVGSYLGPVAAGYVVTGQGWRWMWWWSAIILAINLVLVIFFFEETSYTPNLIGHDATTIEDTDEQHPKSIDGNGPSVKPKNFSGQNDDQAANVHDSATSVERQDRYKPRTYRERMAFITRSPETEHEFKRHFYQPAIILFTFPAVLYAAIAYGTLLSWYSVLSTVESENFLNAPYNWNSSQIGLFNLSPFIGSVIGAIIGGPLNDKAIMWLARRNDGIYEPEMRLWMAIPTIIICPAGILMFGIGLAHGSSWVLVAFGWGIFTLGSAMAMDVALTYVNDCYQNIIGDAIVGVVFVRNSISIIIEFAVTPWIDGIGVQNVHINVAVLAFFFQLATIPLLIWGKKARMATTNKYIEMSGRQMSSRRP